MLSTLIILDTLNEIIKHSKMKSDIRSSLLFLIVLIVCYFITLGIFSKHATHFPYGDGPEYVLMTESFYNHFSPNLHISDIEYYLNYLKTKNFSIPHESHYLNCIKNSDSSKLVVGGYFQSSKDPQLWFSYHFWFYSLICLPVRMVLESIGANIILTHLATNLLVLFIAIAVIARLYRFKLVHRIFLILLLIFSPILWYIDWPHPEAFCGILVYLGTVLFYHKNKLSALLCMSLATTQNLPIGIIALFIFVDILRKREVNIQLLLKLFISSIWAISSILFYLIYFGKTSIISNSYYVSISNISLKRFWHFFFDLNQGIILGIPFILITLCFFLIVDFSRKKLFKEYYLLASIPLMSLLFMQMYVWNDGNAVIKRYAIWVVPLLIISFYFRITKLKSYAHYLLAIAAILIQPFVIFSQQDFTKITWHANSLTPFSKYVFNHYPSFYNPDPLVFLMRVSPFSISTTDSVVVYANKEQQIKKMMIRKGALNQLKLRGIKASTVDSLAKNLTYYNNYTYLNEGDLEKIGYQQEQDHYIHYIDSINDKVLRDKIRTNIFNSPIWLQSINDQAIQAQISLDSAISLNIDYLVRQGKE